MGRIWTSSDALLNTLAAEQAPDSVMVVPGLGDDEIEIDSLDFEDFLEDITEEEFLQSRINDRVGMEEEQDT